MNLNDMLIAIYRAVGYVIVAPHSLIDQSKAWKVTDNVEDWSEFEFFGATPNDAVESAYNSIFGMTVARPHVV